MSDISEQSVKKFHRKGYSGHQAGTRDLKQSYPPNLTNYQRHRMRQENRKFMKEQARDAADTDRATSTA